MWWWELLTIEFPIWLPVFIQIVNYDRAKVITHSSLFVFCRWHTAFFRLPSREATALSHHSCDLLLLDLYFHLPFDLSLIVPVKHWTYATSWRMPSRASTGWPLHEGTMDRFKVIILGALTFVMIKVMKVTIKSLQGDSIVFLLKHVLPKASILRIIYSLLCFYSSCLWLRILAMIRNAIFIKLNLGKILIQEFVDKLFHFPIRVVTVFLP